MCGVRFLLAGCCMCRCVAAAACRPLQSYAASCKCHVWGQVASRVCGSPPCTSRLSGSLCCFICVAPAAAVLCETSHPAVCVMLTTEQTLFTSGFASVAQLWAAACQHSVSGVAEWSNREDIIVCFREVEVLFACCRFEGRGRNQSHGQV
ncbi:hypothetical protein COO60DRAFT_360936 [Scenedesmus sp. NREL 46B-D3]|nr:hypothetical protein COO60DRAFT_360936 [Scenedesmus sp. NREL 46B-D3]